MTAPVVVSYDARTSVSSTMLCVVQSDNNDLCIHEYSVGETLVLDYSDEFRAVTSQLSFPEHRRVTVHSIVKDSPETYYVLCQEMGHMICVDVANYRKHGCTVRRQNESELRSRLRGR